MYENLSKLTIYKDYSKKNNDSNILGYLNFKQIKRNKNEKS